MNRSTASLIAGLLLAGLPAAYAQQPNPANEQFYTALGYQKRSEDPKAPEAEREKYRGDAINAYEAYLAKNPASAGALNNLAQLYARDPKPEQREKALTYYDRAIATKDPRAAAYEVNRAKLLAETGRGESALKSSLAVVRADRRNEAAQSLARSLVEKGGNPVEITEYIRTLDESGLVLRAIETGLDELDRVPNKREPILVALVESLADPTLSDLPSEFLTGDIAKRLRKHEESAEIGKGVRELLLVYQKPADPESLTWWRSDFQDYAELAPKSRAAAMLGLARALGDRCRRAGKQNFDCAEGYYKFAIDFTGTTADPEAFLSLAQVYMNTGRQEKLAEISDKYERALFRGKGGAYLRENKPKIVQFHLALGTMYAYIGKWDDPARKPAGAFFQLEHARQVVSEYNRGASAGDKLQFPVEATELLADGYVRAGKTRESTRVRVETAEQMLAVGDKRGAAEVVNEKWIATLPADTEVGMKGRVDKVKVATRRE
jgi:hypothetical protein